MGASQGFPSNRLPEIAALSQAKPPRYPKEWPLDRLFWDEGHSFGYCLGSGSAYTPCDCAGQGRAVLFEGIGRLVGALPLTALRFETPGRMSLTRTARKTPSVTVILPSCWMEYGGLVWLKRHHRGYISSKNFSIAK